MTAVRPDVPGLPETVPARMVNEFVYCPRLFYLEWVQGRFATSDDVEEGLYVHRVVDEPGGDLPDPGAGDLERFAGRTSRSFWLTSATLGVSAKIDIVEVGDGGVVTPVDYKKGSPDRNGHAWPRTRSSPCSRHCCCARPATGSSRPRSGTPKPAAASSSRSPPSG